MSASAAEAESLVSNGVTVSGASASALSGKVSSVEVGFAEAAPLCGGRLRPRPPRRERRRGRGVFPGVPDADGTSSGVIVGRKLPTPVAKAKQNPHLARPAAGLMFAERAGMNNRLSNVQAELKTTRQLLVRFAHAPCVKLTLQTRPDTIFAPTSVRILRLEKAGTARPSAQ
jgi:hypothetical protein